MYFIGRLWGVGALNFAALPFDIAVTPIAVIFQSVSLIREVFKSVRGNSTKDFEEFDELSPPCVSTPEQEDDFHKESDISPINLISVPIALAILGSRAKFFRSQLGLPEEDSDEFKKMKPEFQKRMRKFYPKEKPGFLKRCFSIYMKSIYIKGKTVFPLLGTYKSPGEFLRSSLENLLKEMEQLAIDLLDETPTQTNGESTDEKKFQT